MHEASNHGHLEIAEWLIRAGANVNARGLEDETPLHDATRNGHVKVCTTTFASNLHRAGAKVVLCVASASALATLFNPFLSPCAFCSDLRFLLNSRQPGFTGVYFSFAIPSRAGRWGTFLLNATEMALAKLKSFLGIFTCSSSCTKLN